MRARIELLGMREALSAERVRIEGVTIEAMTEVMEGLKEELRDDVFGAGLGERLARTWRGRVYENRGRGDGAAAFVWSRAPKIMRYFSEDRVIRARGGRFLAIPTDDAPRKPGGGRMTPAEVENKFGRPLQFISPGDRGFQTPSARRGGVGFLVMKELVIRKSSQRWRNASAREKARGRRPLQAVIMFILVPVVRGRKRLDLEAAARRWAARAPKLIESRLEAGA